MCASSAEEVKCSFLCYKGPSAREHEKIAPTRKQMTPMVRHNNIYDTAEETLHSGQDIVYDSA
jgi:hypothetical protein